MGRRHSRHAKWFYLGDCFGRKRGNGCFEAGIAAQGVPERQESWCAVAQEDRSDGRTRPSFELRQGKRANSAGGHRVSWALVLCYAAGLAISSPRMCHQEARRELVAPEPARELDDRPGALDPMARRTHVAIGSGSCVLHSVEPARRQMTALSLVGAPTPLGRQRNQGTTASYLVFHPTERYLRRLTQTADAARTSLEEATSCANPS